MSFQICPGRQNFEGSVPLLGHSGFSVPKTDEEKTIINIEVATYCIILPIDNALFLNKKVMLFKRLPMNTTNFYFILGVIIMHVVDDDAYNFPVFTLTRLPTATPVDLPECSTIPIAST